MLTILNQRGEDMYDTMWTLELLIHFVQEIPPLGHNQKLETKSMRQPNVHSLYGTVI